MTQAALTSADIFPTDGTIYIDFTQVDVVATGGTPPDDAAGAKVETNKGGALYCKVGTGGCSAGDFVSISTSATTGIRTAVKLDTTDSGSTPKKGAIAISTALVDNYAWFLFEDLNQVPVNVANSVSTATGLTTTATAGQLGAGGDTVFGILTNEASGASGLTSCSSIGALGTNI